MLLSLYLFCILVPLSSCKYIETAVNYVPKGLKPMVYPTNSSVPHDKPHYNISISQNKNKDVKKLIDDHFDYISTTIYLGSSK